MEREEAGLGIGFVEAVADAEIEEIEPGHVPPALVDLARKEGFRLLNLRRGQGNAVDGRC